MEAFEKRSPSGRPGWPCAPCPRRHRSRSSLLPLGKLADLWAEEAEAARAARLSGVPRGPVTGVPALDRELGGYLTPGLHFVHGESGTGKTAHALQVAATCGAPAVFVTCEIATAESAAATTSTKETRRMTRAFLSRRPPTARADAACGGGGQR